MPDFPLHTRSRLKRYEISEQTTPNYQFAIWLKQLYEEAASRDSKLQFAYRKALDAMIKWPEKLHSGREAGKLPGIGPSISAKLDEKLRQQQVELGIVPEIPDGAVFFSEDLDMPTVKKTKQTKTPKEHKAKPVKEYVPTYRSAPYSVLIALMLHLHQDLQNGPLNKSDLIMKAQVFCTSSLNDGMFPSINGALKILEEKDLLGRLGNPPHFILTQKGADLAEKLWKKGEKGSSQIADFSFSPINPQRLFEGKESSLQGQIVVDSGIIRDLECFTWPPGSFEIVLLVDIREIRSREDRNYLSERLNQLGILSEVRNLELGDFIWVARRINNKAGDGQERGRAACWTDTEEIVLDTLIERKREDDLIASLADGRFREQKHRIARSQLSSTFYLVERGGNGATNEFLGGTEERLLAATLQCQVIDGLMYRQTGGLDESIVFLAALHQQLKSLFLHKTITACALKACDFNYKSFPLQFSKLKLTESSVLMNYTAYALLNAKSTNQSASDIFLRQLLTIKGVTFDKACAILKQIGSPRELYIFYKDLPNELAKQDAFKNFTARDGKKFGAALSKKIFQVFGSR